MQCFWELILHALNGSSPGCHSHWICSRSDSRLPPGKCQVLKSLQVFTTPSAALEGNTHAERKGRLEPGGWFLFLQVLAVQGRSRKGEIRTVSRTGAQQSSASAKQALSHSKCC